MEIIKLLFLQISFLLVYLASSTWSLSVPAFNLSTDEHALLSFKNNVIDPKNMIATNWSISTPVCNWIGVTCSTRHNRVAAMDLPFGLMGTIAPDIGNLSFLVRLNLANNSFHGKPPMEVSYLRRLKYLLLDYNDFDEGPLPEWLGSLTHLQYLSLSHNKFSGSLPLSLSNLTMLEKLNLRNNFLSGNAPEELNKLRSLEMLDIGSNKFTGKFPSFVLNISSLLGLDMTNNSIIGRFPANICQSLPHISNLYLSLNNLNGVIPPSIRWCSKLQVWSMSYNNLSGPLPREIGNLTSLERLYIGNNNLRGPLPREIGNLTRLEKLHIGYNDLQGELTEEIGNLHQLRELTIQSASLRGKLPERLGNLNNLEIIAVPENNLSGAIPTTISNLTKLRALSITKNQIYGSLPQNMGLKMPNLESLFLGINLLRGTIPSTLSNASKLNMLDLSSNQFSGTIPNSLGNLKDLTILNLFNNNLSAPSSSELSLLTSLSKCKQLRVLMIGENPLNSRLPKTIGNLSISLELFDSSRSGLKGMLPSEIGNLSKVVSLSLRDNKLTGEIPHTVNHLSNLQMIRLTGNQFYGRIPTTFCYLGNLGHLDLGGNKISGSIPTCLANISSLRYIYLGSNNLISQIPINLWSLVDLLKLDLSSNYLNSTLSSDISNLKSIISLDLSFNNFSGVIPSTIGSLVNMQYLSLAKNKLQGVIPAEPFGKLWALEYCDLSYNNLTGEIPTLLERLTQLHSLNVSYNMLSGEVPHQGRFSTFPIDSFVGNKGLCGVPWFTPCPESSLHKPNKKRKTLEIVFISLAIVVVVLTSIVVFIIKKRKRARRALPGDEQPINSHKRVSFYELQKITNGFSETNLLGVGSFSSVYKGVLADGTIWAVKVFNSENEYAFKSFDRECLVLCNIRHRNLTRVITNCSTPDFKALVLEYMSNGSLEQWLHGDQHRLRLIPRLEIMIDVACAMEYFHHGLDSPAVHCDLKPSNILLDENMIGHVSDFGISKLLGEGESLTQTKTLATLGYMAPEYGSNGIVSTKSDVYSFGVLLMESFTGRKPSDDIFSGDVTLQHWVKESIPNSMIEIIDSSLQHHDENDLLMRKSMCVCSIMELALDCTKEAPDQRINMKDAVVALRKVRLSLLND